MFGQAGHIVLTPLYCDLIVLCFAVSVVLVVASAGVTLVTSRSVVAPSNRQQPASVASWQSLEMVDAARETRYSLKHTHNRPISKIQLTNLDSLKYDMFGTVGKQRVCATRIWHSFMG